MDQIVQKALRFGSFELDLNRFCLRANGQSFELRPKTFEVLRLLAENPGQLLSKETLYREVWPGVVVGDDSLSQCIHELRQHLGDTERRLIKTVSRRGYRLDARPVEISGPPDESRASSTSDIASSGTAAQPDRSRVLSGRRWAVAASTLIAVAAGLVILKLLWPVSGLSPTTALTAPVQIRPSDNELTQLAVLTAEKELPLPEFEILKPAADVPVGARGFVGIWVSNEAGWTLSQRQMMMIVTSVDSEGTLRGYLSNGPARQFSHVPGVAFASRFKARITDRTMRYDGDSGLALATLGSDGRIEYKLEFRDGGSGSVMLDPVWTLATAGSAAAPPH